MTWMRLEGRVSNANNLNLQS